MNFRTGRTPALVKKTPKIENIGNKPCWLPVAFESDEANRGSAGFRHWPCLEWRTKK
jgi:hypothetical protein